MRPQRTTLGHANKWLKLSSLPPKPTNGTIENKQLCSPAIILP